MSKPEALKLGSIAGGGVSEVFDHEMHRALENIADPNTKSTAKRSITIKITLKPNEARSLAEIEYDIKTSLPGIETMKSSAYIAMDKGELNLYPFDTRQNALPFGEHREPLTTEIVPQSKASALPPTEPMRKGN